MVVAKGLVAIAVCLFHFSFSQEPTCPMRRPCRCDEHPSKTAKRSQKILTCKHSGINSIPEILSTTFVSVADFSDNKLKRIRKGELNKLRCGSLKLRNNKLLGIQKDSLFPLKDDLKHLDISKNSFKFVPVNAIRHLNNLEYLDISLNNAIAKLIAGGFSTLKKLHTLNLSGNKLSKISAKAFVGLERSLLRLDMSNSKLESFPVGIRNLHNLSHLLLKNSGKYKFPDKAFSGMTNLTYLDISRNNLGKTDFLTAQTLAGIENTLEFLDISHCQLTVLPKTLSLLKNLKTLNLYGNNIPIYSDGSFSSLTSLRDLNIGGFPIKFTSKLFEGLEKTLTHLRLSMSSMIALPENTLKGLPNLKYIDLSRNKFVYVPPYFSTGSSVSEYNFDYNDIRDISKMAFEVPSTGKRLILSLKSCLLGSIRFTGNPCLFQKIDLQRNRIHCDCDVYRLLFSNVEVIGHCLHKNQLIKINDDRFRQYYPGKCKGREVDCSKVDSLSTSRNILSPFPSPILSTALLKRDFTTQVDGFQTTVKYDEISFSAVNKLQTTIPPREEFYANFTNYTVHGDIDTGVYAVIDPNNSSISNNINSFIISYLIILTYFLVST